MDKGVRSLGKAVTGVPGLGWKRPSLYNKRPVEDKCGRGRALYLSGQASHLGRHYVLTWDSQGWEAPLRLYLELLTAAVTCSLYKGQPHLQTRFAQYSMRVLEEWPME